MASPPAASSSSSSFMDFALSDIAMALEEGDLFICTRPKRTNQRIREVSKTCYTGSSEQDFAKDGKQDISPSPDDERSNKHSHEAGNRGSSSEGTGSTLTGGNNHHRETFASYNDMPMVIFDNQSQVNCTGKFEVLSDLNIGPENIVLIAANGEEMPTYMSGSVRQGNFYLTNVHFCPDVGNRVIVSGSELDKDDFKYEISRGEIIVTDLKTGRIVGKGRLVDGNYILDYLKIPRDRTTGLVTTVWNAVCSALHRLGL